MGSNWKKWRMGIDNQDIYPCSPRLVRREEVRNQPENHIKRCLYSMLTKNRGPRNILKFSKNEKIWVRMLKTSLWAIRRFMGPTYLSNSRAEANVLGSEKGALGLFCCHSEETQRLMLVWRLHPCSPGICIGALLLESASGDEVLIIQGIVPAEIIAVCNFPRPVHLQQKSISADQSRRWKDNTIVNTTLNPSQRQGTGRAEHFVGSSISADWALQKRALSFSQNFANCLVEPGVE